MKTLQDSKLSARVKVYKESPLNSGLKTGLKSVDDYLKGLGFYVSIQGETSSCKSTLALQIVHYNLRRGIPCLMIDKENGERRTIERLVCQAEKTFIDNFPQNPENRLQLLKKVEDLCMHVHVEEISKSVLEERIEECWKLYQKPFVVLIDSVQALDPIAESEDGRLSLEDWVRFFDRLKVEYGERLTVIQVSETNRSSYGTFGIGRGKGSNVLDFKPETVLDLRWNQEDDTFSLHVAKHRDGLRGQEFVLQKELVDQNNPRSFCFRLQEPRRHP